jgi:hypothetical protein
LNQSNCNSIQSVENKITHIHPQNTNEKLDLLILIRFIIIDLYYMLHVTVFLKD